MTYLIVIILILFGVFNFDFGKKSKNRYMLYNLIVVYLILLAGLAYRMGEDGVVYETRYSFFGTLNDINRSYFSNQLYLPGWVFISTLCKSITNSYTLFKIVHSCIVNLIFADFIKRNISLPYTGLLFYFIVLYFDLNFGLLRQALSISIFVFSLRYFCEDNLKKYFLCCLVALSFHESAIIVFLLPFLRFLKFNRRNLIILLILIFFISYFASFILQSFISYSFGTETSIGRLNHYTQGVSDEVSFSLSNIVFNIIIPTFLLAKLYKRINFNYFSLLAFGYIFIYLFASFVPIVYRLNFYFLPFYMMLWVEAVYYFVNKLKFPMVSKVILSVCIIFSFCVFKKRLWFSPIEGTKIPHYATVYPYTSVLFEEKIPDREYIFSNLDF